MSLTITGKLHAKFPTQQIKENFSKREFVLELTEEGQNGAVYKNYASLQLSNALCSVIDNFQEGDTLTVNFNIRGNKWERDGQIRYITNLNAWRVEKIGQQQLQQQFQQTPGPNGGQGYQQVNNDPDGLPF